MMSVKFTTRVKPTPYGLLYLTYGPTWGPLKSNAPLDVVYFVWSSDGRRLAVCATLGEATYEAAWARRREGVPHTWIMRSDGVRVEEDCDACGNQCEAMWFPSSPEMPEYRP